VNFVRQYLLVSVDPFQKILNMNPFTPPGLIGVVAPATTLPSEQVRATLENLVRSEANDMGVPMNISLPVMSVFSGAVNRFSSYVQQVEMYEKSHAGKLKPLDQRHIGHRASFEWTREEGFQHLRELLEEDDRPCCVSLHQHVDGALAPQVIEGLRRIDTAARRKKKHVMLFMTFQNFTQAASLSQFVDNFIEIRPCEPDPGALLAFSIECISMRHQHALGVGHAMVQIKLSKDGHYLTRMDRFLAAGLTDRVIAYMRAESTSLADIGKVVHLNKSTVLRRLAALPSHWTPTPKANWKEKFSTRFDFKIEE
jgi:hypothetical protein